MENRRTVWGDELDGRPIYQYRLTEVQVDTLEAFLDPTKKIPDSKRLKALAPVATARFASTYRGGPPSWEDCGATVLALYGTTQASQARFRGLIEDSFKYYGVSLIKGSGGTRYLETVISQAGIPVGTLGPASPMRQILEDLMEKAALGEGDLLMLASDLVDKRTDDSLQQNQGLRSAYKNAGHLPALCVEIVEAIRSLVRDSNWAPGESLERLWDVPGWEKRLPFMMPIESAQEMVRRLLGVAVKAVGEQMASVQRVLVRTSRGWLPVARVAIPEGGVEVEQRLQLGDRIKTWFLFDGKPAEEAIRFKNRGDGHYVAVGAAADLPPELVLVNREIAIGVLCGETIIRFPCRASEALEAGAVWVFSESGSDSFIFRAHAPARLKAKRLVAVAPADATASGDAALIQHELTAFDGRRKLWSVSGAAVFTLPSGDQVEVASGEAGPERTISITGKSPLDFRAQGFSSLFIGAPSVRQSRSLDGADASVQWRKQGQPAWMSLRAGSPVGAISYRLIDNAGRVHSERRQVLVLPSDFHWKVSHDRVQIAHGDGVRVLGASVASDGSVDVSFQGRPSVTVDVAFEGLTVGLVFDAPRRQRFIDVVTGQTTTGRLRVTTKALQRIEARSSVANDMVYLGRANQPPAEHLAVPLRAGTLQFLRRVRGLIDDLCFDRRGRTHSITAYFLNGPELVVAPYRLRRDESSVFTDENDPDLRVELWPLLTGEASIALNKDPGDPRRWDIPRQSEPHYFHLAVDVGSQASPCLIRHGYSADGEYGSFVSALSIEDEMDRVEALRRFYVALTSEGVDWAASSEIHAWSHWMSKFSRWSRWLDAYLVLSSDPALGLKLLLWSKVSGQMGLAEVLAWHFDRVPFFWHRITPDLIWGALDHLATVHGPAIQGQALEFLSQFPLIREMQRVSGFSVAERTSCLSRWEQTVVDWHAGCSVPIQARTPTLSDQIRASLIQGEESSSRIPKLPQNVSPDIEPFRTLLFAPQELGFAVSRGLAVAEGHQDSLLYARHILGTDSFDQAFYSSLMTFSGAAP